MMILLFPGVTRNASADSSKFSHVADEDTIDKNSGAIGVHIELDFGGHLRHLNPAVALHGHADDLLFAGQDADFLGEVQITSLADCDFVFTWQEEDLFGPLQFRQITEILPIDPYPGRSLYFSGAQDVRRQVFFPVGNSNCRRSGGMICRPSPRS
jgi:hypothetical protein